MPSAAHATARAPTRRVLVIDDEPNVASFVGRALRAKGFEIDVVLGTEAGLAAALHGGHALIVLDLRMRDVNRLAILRRLMRVRPEPRVLVLAAASDVDVEARCLGLGAVDVYVHRLREKLGRRAVQTVRNLGYGVEVRPAGR